MVEILGVIVAVDESANGRKISLSEIMNAGLSKAWVSMSIKNAGLFVFEKSWWLHTEAHQSILLNTP